MMTPTRLDELVRACFLAGLAPAILAPILWPIVLMLHGNGMPDLPLVAIASITGMALLVGMIGCLFIGLPCIFVADRIGLNRPVVMGALGALVSIAIFFVIPWAYGNALPLSSWPLFLFAAVIGATCGAIASILSPKARN